MIVDDLATQDARELIISHDIYLLPRNIPVSAAQVNYDCWNAEIAVLFQFDN